MPNQDEIKYTQYVPSQQLSIDDLSKILYEPNQDLMIRNADALSKIAAATEGAGNATEAYINNLKFLPGDESVDRDELLRTANEMIYKPWDEKTSPAELSRFVSEFGKRISPSGDVGKAKARYENKLKWSLTYNDQLATLPKADSELLENEMDNVLLGMDNVPQMEEMVLSNKVTALPDFDTILSSQALHPIITAGWNTTDGYRNQGLRYESTKKAINGKIEQDGSIQNWLDQYNRIHKTNYNLSNCITGYDEKGNAIIKSDIPDELKGAITDAWERCTEYAIQKRPVSVSKEQSKEQSNSSGNGSKTDSETPTMYKTATLYYDSTYGNLGYILDHNPSKLGITGVTFYNSDKDELLGSIVSKNEDGSYGINFDPNKFKTINGKNYYLIGDEKNQTIAFEYTDKAALDNLANTLENYVTKCNDVVLKSEFASLSQTNLSNTSKKFFGSNFNVLVRTEGKDGFVSDPTYKFDAGNIVSIDGYSFSSEFGDILFMATMKDGDNNKDVILALNDNEDLNNICRNLLSHLTSMDVWGEFFLKNPEYIKFGTEWQRQAIQTDGQGRYYKEIQFNYDNFEKTGVDTIPSNFIGYSMRMILPKEADEEMFIQMVDRNGNPVKVGGNDVMSFSSMNRFYNALKTYQDYYENPAYNNLGDDISEYITNSIIGRTLDYDLQTLGTQTYFAGRQRMRSYKESDYGGYVMQLLALEKNNDSNMLSSDFINGEKVPVGKNVCLGDIVYDITAKQSYMIVRYGNQYILVDGNRKYQGIYTPNMKANRAQYRVYEGKYRGQKVNLQ